MGRIAFLLSLLALTITFAATAGATRPAAASGTISGGSIELIDFHANGATSSGHITVTGAAIAGTFSGIGVNELDEVVNPTGNSTLQGSFICDPCTVDGRSGSVVFRQVGTITGEPFFLDMHTVSVSATGGLAGLHAEFDLRWNGVDPATYSGSYHFEP
jgi:hypothetical protein